MTRAREGVILEVDLLFMVVVRACTCVRVCVRVYACVCASVCGVRVRATQLVTTGRAYSVTSSLVVSPVLAA